MTISYSDNINRLNDYINKNSIIQHIFGNSLILSLIISCIVIIIINVNIDNKPSQFIYSFVFIFCSILIFNKIIKSKYCDKDIIGKGCFIDMMENNIASKNINIIKKLDNNISNISDIDNFLK